MKNFLNLFKKTNNTSIEIFTGLIDILDDQEEIISQKENEFTIEISRKTYFYEFFYICFTYGLVDYLSKNNEEAFMEEVKRITKIENVEEAKLSMTKNAFIKFYNDNRLIHCETEEWLSYTNNECAQVYDWFVTSLENKNENVQSIIIKGYELGVKIGKNYKEKKDNYSSYVDFFSILHDDYNEPYWSNLDFESNNYLDEKIIGRKIIFDFEYFVSQLTNEKLIKAIKKNETLSFELIITYVCLAIHELDLAYTDKMMRSENKLVGLNNFFNLENEQNEHMGINMYTGLAYGCLEAIEYHQDIIKKNFNDILKQILFEKIEHEYPSDKQQKYKDLFNSYVEAAEDEPSEDNLSPTFRALGRKAFKDLHYPPNNPNWSNLGLYNFIKNTK
mgnify:CR=1 FL=1